MPEQSDRGTGVRRQLPRIRFTVLLATSAIALAVLGPLSAIAVAAGVPGDGGSGLVSTTPSTAPASGTKTTALPVSSTKTTPTATTSPSTGIPFCPGTAPSLGGTSSGGTTSGVVTVTTPAVTRPTTAVPSTTPVGPVTTTTTPGPPTATVAATNRSTTAVGTTNTATATTNPCLTGPQTIGVPKTNPFASNGMWIWEMGSTQRGNVPAIGSQARQFGIRTVMIKAGDGTTWWSQFNPETVRTLHAWGLHVCAWQFVYGTHPLQEAAIGARAVRTGADCLVIDAESQYQGLYVQAQAYMSALRAQIGARFPVALAGFPYIDYHPSFPYSVFLGPNGAQYNVPQMYWRDIGTSVTAVYSHTYAFNQLYQRPIFPLGQVFDSPPASQINQFRAIARYYGAKGVSWWDWQSAGASEFTAVWSPIGSIVGFVPQRTVASLDRGAKGDVVVWAQEHLVKAGQRVTVDGDFGKQTRTAVSRFQSAHGLPANGAIGPATWNALLRYQPLAIKWTLTKRRLSAVVARDGDETLPVPHSASLSAKRNELGGTPGQGKPSTARR